MCIQMYDFYKSMFFFKRLQGYDGDALSASIAHVIYNGASKSSSTEVLRFKSYDEFC